VVLENDFKADRALGRHNPAFADAAPKGEHRECPVEVALEYLLDWSALTFGEQELVSAKEEFFWKTGKVFYDDPFYNTRMSYFQDYFLFQRPLAVAEKEYRSMSPFILYSEKQAIQHPLAITGTLHSIFQVTKCLPAKMWVTDLLDASTKYEIQLRTGQSFCGISKKDIFQGFLYANEDVNVLSYGVVFHPSDATSLIKKQAKFYQKDQSFDKLRLLSRWAYLQIRHLRHLHVDPRRIYEDPLR